MIFRNRYDAGRRLAANLSRFAGRPDVLILALPRGGVPVGFEVAKALKAPLDVFLVRKLGLPGHEELAMGAVATGGIRVWNPEVLERARVTKKMIEAATTREEIELHRRERAYRGDRPPIRVEGKTVILVDDGLATGASMRAAVAALRQKNPTCIVVAVPVAAPDTCEEFREFVDEIVCAETPEPFLAVGRWYEEFEQTGDQEVRQLLHSRAAAPEAAATAERR